MKIQIAEIDKIEIKDFNNSPFLDRMLGSSNFLIQGSDESNDDFKKRIAENTSATSFYYDHINNVQQSVFNKTAKQMIQGLVVLGYDTRKLKREYRKIGLIKGKY